MWESVLSGVIANFIFLIFLALISSVVWLFFYGKKLWNATRFLGMGLDGKVYIYVSAHADQETRTQKVVTAEEFESAIELHSALVNQFQRSGRFYELAVAIAQLIRFEVQMPDFIVKVSPLDEVTALQPGKSLILIGGPTRNQVSKYYLRSGNSWLTFDDDKKKFLINRGDRKGEELTSSGNMAIVSKIIIENRIAFLIFGFGEIETKCALNYFVHNWRDLHKEFKQKEFGVCLLIDSEDNVQVQMKLSNI